MFLLLILPVVNLSGNKGFNGATLGAVPSSSLSASAAEWLIKAVYGHQGGVAHAVYLCGLAVAFFPLCG